MAPLIVLAAAGFTAGIVWLIHFLLRTSEPCQMALREVRQTPRAAAVLGLPIEATFFLSGSIKVRNSTGKAVLSVPVRGQHGSGLIHVKATKSGGQWTLTSLQLENGATREVLVLRAPMVSE